MHIRVPPDLFDSGWPDGYSRTTLDPFNFGDPETSVANKFGVKQFGCRHCGGCDIRCNFQAKHTLDLNYLAVAEQRGADVGTRCEESSRQLCPTEVAPNSREDGVDAVDVCGLASRELVMLTAGTGRPAVMSLVTDAALGNSPDGATCTIVASRRSAAWNPIRWVLTRPPDTAGDLDHSSAAPAQRVTGRGSGR